MKLVSGPLHQPSRLAEFLSLASRPRTLRALVALSGSLADRLLRLEGALLAVNLSLLIVSQLPPVRALLLALASTLTLAVLYAFNDWWDVDEDVHNPRKNPWLVELHASVRGDMARFLFAASAWCVVLGYFGGGGPSGAAVLAVIGINAAYSKRLKGVPILDVLWCGLWGAAYAAIVCREWQILVLVGLMTAICHVYQTLADRETDARNGRTTTAASVPHAVPVTLLAPSLIIAVLLWFRGEWNWTFAASALTPILPYYLVQNRITAWLLTKAYFAVLWLAVLVSSDGFS